MSRVRRSETGLAVDIPADVADRLGLAEGDDVHVQAGPGGSLRIEPDLSVSYPSSDPELKAKAIERLLSVQERIPTDFKFNRDEANER